MQHDVAVVRPSLLPSAAGRGPPFAARRGVHLPIRALPSAPSARRLRTVWEPPAPVRVPCGHRVGAAPLCTVWAHLPLFALHLRTVWEPPLFVACLLPALVCRLLWSATILQQARGEGRGALFCISPVLHVWCSLLLTPQLFYTVATLLLLVCICDEYKYQLSSTCCNPILWLMISSLVLRFILVELCQSLLPLRTSLRILGFWVQGLLFM